MKNTSDKRKFELSINNNITNKGNAGASGWHNTSFTIDEFINHIKSGFAWGAGVFIDPDHREKASKKDIKKAILFAIDVDNELKEKQADGTYKKRKKTDEEGYWSFNEALNDLFIKDNALLMYKSPSFTNEWNKFRIVFLLPDYIHTIEKYEIITKAFINFFQSDTSCKGWERLWYSNNNDPDIHLLGNTIRQKSIDDIVMMYGSKPEKKPQIQQTDNSGNGDAIGDYKRKADVHQLLTKHGWSLVRTQGKIEYWKRPGETDKPHSASFNYYPGEFYCFTSSTQFEAGKTYDAFGLYEMLEHNGDTKMAVKELYDLGFGKNGHNLKVAKPDKPLMNGNNDDVIEVDIIDFNSGEFLYNRELKAGFVIECLNTGQRGDMQLIHHIKNNQWLYDHSIKKWLLYKDGFWNVSKKEETLKEIICILISVYNALYDYASEKNKTILNNASENGEQEQKYYIGLLKLIGKRLKYINDYTDKRKKDVSNLTATWLATSSDEFDDDPYILNLPNGVYDLKNDKFYDNNPKYLCKLVAGVPYDDKVYCDKWLDFIATIFERDKEIMRFVKQSFGIWLSGVTDEQNFIFAHGGGANGKSTFFSAVQIILNGFDKGKVKSHGGYFYKIPSNALSKSKYSDNNTASSALASIQGIRLAIASELDQDIKINEALIKDMVGGESVSARKLYGDTFIYSPTFKLAIYGNNKPDIDDSSHGFWRRMLLLPFNVSIPDKDQRKQSDMYKEFYEEGSGILNWALEGWQDYKLNGLIIPGKVKAATKDYQIEVDIFENYFQDQNDFDIIDPSNKEVKTLSSYFFEKFKKWGNENPDERNHGYDKLNNFNKDLRKKGFTIKKSTGNKLYIFGVKRSDEEQIF